MQLIKSCSHALSSNIVSHSYTLYQLISNVIHQHNEYPRSKMINTVEVSERLFWVLKCGKMIWPPPELCPTPLREPTALPRNLSWWVGLTLPPQKPQPTLGPSSLVTTPLDSMAVSASAHMQGQPLPGPMVLFHSAAQVSKKSLKSRERAFTCDCGDQKSGKDAKQDVDVWTAHRNRWSQGVQYIWWQINSIIVADHFTHQLLEHGVAQISPSYTSMEIQTKVPVRFCPISCISFKLL